MEEPNIMNQLLEQESRKAVSKAMKAASRRFKEKNKVEKTAIDGMTYEELYDYSIMLGLNLDQDITLKDLVEAIEKAGG